MIFRALQAVWCTGVDIAVFERNLRAQALQAGEVNIDRPRADGAAARQRYGGLAKARQERPQYENGSAHAAHQFIGRDGAGDITGSENKAVVRIAIVGRGNIDAELA